MWIARKNTYGLHVCPSGEEHLLHRSCDCNPQVIDEMDMEYPVIVHNAFDGRELLDVVQEILDSSPPFEI